MGQRKRSKRDEPDSQDRGRRGTRPPRARRRFLPLLLGTSGGVALAAGAFWFFRKQAREVLSGDSDSLDAAVIERVQALRSPAADRVMKIATDVGSHPSVAAAAILTSLAMRRKGRPHDAWTVLVSTGGAMVMATALKAIIERERPADQLHHIALPSSKSFPSAHSLMAAATWPIIAHHLVDSEPPPVQLAAQAAAAALTVTIGTSRVYFGVHYPSDVFGGFAAGFGWLGLTALSHTIIDREIERKG